MRFSTFLLGLIVAACGLSRAFALPFQVAESQVTLSGAAGFNHLPVSVAVTSSEAGFDASALTVISDASWVTPTVDAATRSVVLSFATDTLSGSNRLATITVAHGADAATFFVRLNSASDYPTIWKLLDDPFRSRTYGLQVNGNNQGSVVIIEPLTGNKIGNLSVGNKPTGLAVSNDGTELFVLNCYSRSISVINLTSLAVTETIPLINFDIYDDPLAAGNIATGTGDLLYYTDASSGPVLRVFNRSTRQVLQTLYLDPNSYAGFGAFALTPDKKKLFGWAQVGWGAGWAGSYAGRYTVNPDGTLTFAEVTNSSYPTTLSRDPVNTPVLIPADGSRVLIKQLVFDPTSLATTLGTFPGPVYAISPGGEIATTSNAIYGGLSGLKLMNLPVTTSVQAVTSDYARLVYYNPNTRELATLNLISALGPETLGQKLTPPEGSTVVSPAALQWPSEAGIDTYRVYLGTSSDAVAAATPASPQYLGQTVGASFALTTTLSAGTTYYWRVDSVSAFETVPSVVRSFTVSALTTSLAKIEAVTVQGHVGFPVPVVLNSLAPTAWQATASEPWVRFVQSSGTSPGTLEVRLDASLLPAGVHTATLTLADAGTTLFTLPVQLKVEPLKLTRLRSDPLSKFAYGISENPESPGSPAYLLEMDTETETIRRVLPVGSSVTDFTLHNPEGRIYVTNWLSGALLVIDRQTFAKTKTITFSPAGPTGYGANDVYRVSAGVAGRIVVEEQDQHVDLSIFNTETGAELATAYGYSGSGAFDPTGRYYYHGSGGDLSRFDVTGDVFTKVGATAAYGYNGVFLSESGNGVFYAGAYFTPELGHLWNLGPVYSCTPDSRFAFGENLIYDTLLKETALGMPVATRVSAYNSTTQKLIVQQGESLVGYPVSLPFTLASPVLSAGKVEATSVTLSWTDRTLETGFTLQYRVVGAADWVSLSPVAQNVSTFTATSLAPLTSYEFRVKAETLNLSSPWSNVMTIKTLDTPPGTPYLSSPNLSPTAAQLFWSDSDKETSFVLERANYSGNWWAPDLGPWAPLATVPADTLTYTDTTVVAGASYYYSIKAVVGDLASGTHSIAVTIPTPQPPYPPSPVTATFSTTASSTVNLTWTNVFDETGYRVERLADASVGWITIATLSADATTYADNTVTIGTSYHYRVSAFNDIGSSAPSTTYNPITPVLVDIVVRDSFDPGRSPFAWGPGSQGMVLHGPAGFRDSNALWFGGAGLRSTTTIPVDVSEGAVLSFDFRAGNQAVDGQQHWDDSEGYENVYLEYSLNGSQWHYWDQLSTTPAQAGFWASFNVPVPSAALSPATQFRWRQVDHSGVGSDPWALDNVSITAIRSAPIAAPAAPGALVAAASSSTVATLLWSSTYAAASYQVERASPGQPWTVIAAVPVYQNYFVDASVLPQSGYSYRVRAVNGGGISNPSNTSYVLTLTQAEDWLLTNLGEPAPQVQNVMFQAGPDGMANLLRFAFNLNLDEPAIPLTHGTGDRGLPSVGLAPASGRLRVEFVRRRAETSPGVNYRTEFASSPATGWIAGGVIVSVVSLDQVWERVTVEDSAPEAGGSLRFGRVVLVAE